MRFLLPIRIVLLFAIAQIVSMKHLLIEINPKYGETVDSYRQLPVRPPLPRNDIQNNQLIPNYIMIP